MCQIQFIKRKGECLDKRDISEFFKLMELGSVNNNCAFGLFNDKIFFKSKGRFNLHKFKEYEKLSESSFVVGHNRLATTGSNKNNFNNHPFKFGDFILVHNGVINNDLELRHNYNIFSKIQTDSYVIIWLINHFFKKSKIEKRTERVIDAIKKTANKLEGQFSVFLYDKGDGNLYYFKNKPTDFCFCIYDNTLLVGTTNINNINHIFLDDKYVFDFSLFKEREIKEIKENKIYLINDFVLIKEVGEFKAKECGNYWTSSYGSYGAGSYEYSDEDYFDDLYITEQIDKVFKLCLGYVPDYKFIGSAWTIKIKYDEFIAEDLSIYIPDLFIENKHIHIDIDDLLSLIN